jgi:hypothetical protein
MHTLSMRSITGATAAIVLVGAAVGFASPAHADNFSGTFIPNGPGMACGDSSSTFPTARGATTTAQRQEAPGYAHPVFFTLTRI